MSDKDALAEQFELQANSQAWRTQYHRCTATCVKYSYKPTQGSGDGSSQTSTKPTCRFRCPWALHEATTFNKDGDLVLKRSNGFINRWNKTLAVGLRHNHDISFLNSTSQSLSMIYYATNYATKLETPMWQRLALGAEVTARLEGEHTAGASSETAQHNSTRQFFMRWANKIFTDREMSAVEVCYHILSYPTDFTSIPSWTFLYPEQLYYRMTRQMASHRSRHSNEENSTNQHKVIFTSQGKAIDRYQAYLDRWEHLENLCFWEYMSFVELRRKSDARVTQDRIKIPFKAGSCLSNEWQQVLRRKGKTALPVIVGYFSPVLEESEDIKYYQR